MNLHGIVRGAIQAVNPDKPGTFLRSTSNTVDAAGAMTPTYADPVMVRLQIQPIGRDHLRHVEQMNLQGVFRTVFMFGNVQGVNRPNQQGGDLLTFSPYANAPMATWLTVLADSPWDVEQGGWSKILVCLQE